MFENCNSLADLNAERVKLSSQPGCDLVSINNAYNQKRKDIIAGHKPYLTLEPVVVSAREVVQMAGIPVVGRSTVPGVIEMTNAGFLY